MEEFTHKFGTLQLIVRFWITSSFVFTLGSTAALILNPVSEGWRHFGTAEMVYSALVAVGNIQAVLDYGININVILNWGFALSLGLAGWAIFRNKNRQEETKE